MGVLSCRRRGIHVADDIPPRRSAASGNLCLEADFFCVLRHDERVRNAAALWYRPVVVAEPA